jgi:hypothetical protein
VLLLSLVATACGSSAVTTRHPVAVAVYGDSLLYEARDALAEGLAGRSSLVRATPGAAACDFTTQLRHDLERVRPRLVVLETVGNDLTACIGDRGGPRSAAHVRATVRDVAAFVTIAHDAGAHVLIADPPPIGAQSAANAGAVEALARGLRARFARDPFVTFTAAPSEAVAPGRRFTVILPCAPAEVTRSDCHGGRITVRDAYFGIHFCPRTYPSDAALRRGCPVYSSGAQRFGTALAGAIATG